MGFLVRMNSKNPSKSGLFEQKVGVYSRNTPKTRLFTLPGALFKNGAGISRIRYDQTLHEYFSVCILPHFEVHLIEQGQRIDKIILHASV